MLCFRCDEKDREIKRLRDALQQCIDNDNSEYAIGQPRRSDGQRPGGGKWMTPGMIATIALAEVP